MYIAFDTETTGIHAPGKKYKADITDPKSFSSIIQIAWQVFDEDGCTIASEVMLVKPYEAVESEAQAVHGITYEQATTEGVEPQVALCSFANALFPCSAIVGHNCDFDIKMIVGNAFKNGIGRSVAECFVGKKVYDTMKEGKLSCGALNKNGVLKYPKLGELYKSIFGGDMVGAHDAMCDVTATRDIFIALRNNGNILNTEKEVLSCPYYQGKLITDFLTTIPNSEPKSEESTITHPPKRFLK